MARLRVLVFLLLIAGVSDRVFSCESRVGVDGNTYQLCHNPGEFRAAARAVGINDLGIQTFEGLPTGTYPMGVFSELYGDPLGARVVASNSVELWVKILTTRIGNGLVGQGFGTNLDLGFGGGAPPPSFRAIGFDFRYAEHVNLGAIVNLGGLTCCGVFAPGFVGIVSPQPFSFVRIEGFATLILDNLEYPGGPASASNNPYPPEECTPEVPVTFPAAYCFTALELPNWYDPSPATGYEFRTLSGSFVAIDDFPPGFGDAFTVSVGGVSLGRFSPGQRVPFPPGVTQFRITGITPAVDGENPLAFPIKLSFDTVGTTFTMRPLTDDDDVDTTPPQITCQGSDGLWHASDVSITCTASDSGSGLANAADGNFMLATDVPAGTETLNAESNQRDVCDVAGNCTVAGPVGGHRVDKKAPVVTISSPTTGTYTLGQSFVSNYQCADGGSGVASCVGSAPNGTAVQADAVGTRVFEVNASDAAGNPSHASMTFTVTYNVCALFDQATAKKAGSTIPIRLALCNVNGVNVSSPAVQLVATGLRMVSGQTAAQVEDPGNSSPDANFRFTDGSYHFNLKTAGLASGTWELTFTASGDAEPHVIRFQIR